MRRIRVAIGPYCITKKETPQWISMRGEVRGTELKFSLFNRIDRTARERETGGGGTRVRLPFHGLALSCRRREIVGAAPVWRPLAPGGHTQAYTARRWENRPFCLHIHAIDQLTVYEVLIFRPMHAIGPSFVVQGTRS